MSNQVVPQYYDSFGVSPYHAAGVTGVGVVIYVVDTGLEAVTPNVDNVIVEDFASPVSNELHGTYTSELIDGHVRLAGVSYGSQVYLGAVDMSDGTITDGALSRAILSATAKNVDILSISLGTTSDVPDVRSAIAGAVAAGILVFVAAGNSGTSDYEYPASYDGVISVASCTADRQRSSFTTFNDKVAVFAPGENWPLPDNTGTIQLLDGTSFSCPFTAGLAGLILSKQRIATGNTTFRYNRADMLTILLDSHHLGPQAALFGVPFPPATTISVIDFSSSQWILIAIIIGALLIFTAVYYYSFSKPHHKTLHK